MSGAAPPSAHFDLVAAASRPRPLRLGVLAGGMVAVGFFAALVGAALSPNALPVRHVEVHDRLAAHTAAEVERVLRRSLGVPLLGVRVATVRRQLESLPWIAEAGVRRVWPDRLEVWVREQQPVARWGQGQLITADAVLFAPAPQTVPVTLPQLGGPQGRERVVLTLFLRLQTLLSATRLGIRALVLDERRAWSLLLTNEVHIELGRQRPLARMRRLVRVFGDELVARGSQIECIDARYTNGFAVRPVAAGVVKRSQGVRLQGGA